MHLWCRCNYVPSFHRCNTWLRFQDRDSRAGGVYALSRINISGHTRFPFAGDMMDESVSASLVALRKQQPYQKLRNDIGQRSGPPGRGRKRTR